MYILNYFLLVLSCSVVSLCDPMDCSSPGSSVHGDSPDKNTGVGCHALLLRICSFEWNQICLLYDSLRTMSGRKRMPQKYLMGQLEILFHQTFVNILKT